MTRFVPRLLAGLLAGVSLGGCLTPSPLMTTGITSKDMRAVEALGELPAQETAKLQMTLAQKMAREGQTVEAIVQYEKARQNDPRLRGTVAWRLGILYDLGGDPARALVEFQEALKEFPKDPDLLTDLGYCHYNRGEWAQAEKHLRQALARAKKHKRAHMNLAMALCQQGKIEESLAEFTTVVSKAEAQANVGFLLLTQRRPEEAKQAFLKALELEPHLEKPRKALAKMEVNRAGAPDQRGGEQRGLLPAPRS